MLSSGYVLFAIEKVETEDNDAENGIHHIVDEEPGANGEVSGAGKTIALYQNIHSKLYAISDMHYFDLGIHFFLC